MAQMTAAIKIRVPPRLREALRAEAQRRMLTQSALIRMELGKAMGLISPVVREETIFDDAIAQTQ